VRPIVDVEDQGERLRRVEVRRLDDPPLDVAAVERFVGDLLDVAQRDPGEQAVVDRRETGGLLNERTRRYAGFL
jgi:hypothetical protein